MEINGLYPIYPLPHFSLLLPPLPSRRRPETPVRRSACASIDARGSVQLAWPRRARGLAARRRRHHHESAATRHPPLPLRPPQMDAAVRRQPGAPGAHARLPLLRARLHRIKVRALFFPLLNLNPLLQV
jgi:hypothetical protein